MRHTLIPRSTPQRLATALVASSALVGLVAPAATSASPAAPAAASAPSVYVALGDSYSSGPVIPPQADAVTCLRSTVNYPGLVAAKLKVTTFRDVTCSGASTANLTEPQPANTPDGPPAPPQYDALTADTTLVTVGIGGNDIGLVNLGFSCVLAALNPSAPTCQSVNGRKVERKIDAFAATYGTVVDQIRAKAPLARILLVGYPTTVRDGGCFPTQPVKPTDATYIQSLINRLDRRMRDQAVAHGAEYVNLIQSTIGHDVCAPVGEQWTEGAIPIMPAYPLHPNAMGMQNAAKQVVQVLRAGAPS